MAAKKETVTLNPAPGDSRKADLQRIIGYFRDTYPEQWELLKLCPLGHGLDEMVRLLG